MKTSRMPLGVVAVVPVKDGLDGSDQLASFILGGACEGREGFHCRKNSLEPTSWVLPLLYASPSSVSWRVTAFLVASLISFSSMSAATVSVGSPLVPCARRSPSWIFLIRSSVLSWKR